MLRSDLVARARSALLGHTAYRLGAGAPHTAPHPADEGGACDCSGFVCWALRLARYQPALAFLKREVGHFWLNTDAIVADAAEPFGLFNLVRGEARRPGDLLVYPSRAFAQKHGWATQTSPRIGHVGIVTTPEGAVIHCSAGNARHAAGAIAETAPDVFDRVAYTRAVRYVGLED